MVAVDRLSKYSNFIQLAHPFTAIQVAQALLDNIYKLNGLPKVIFSDIDKVFLSKFCQELFKFLDVSLHMKTTYHPQTDGQTRVKCYLRCMTGEKPKEWIHWISLAKYRDNVITLLKFHLRISQDKMKSMTNKKRSGKEIEINVQHNPQLNAERLLANHPVQVLEKKVIKEDSGSL
uniref:Reverse transcriptase n=1 Tax=Tanacetum cinerariifolium TaxID=118510 RepID=A0A6L2J807_TANCI|nr:reverse transcriptase [Tanacetum cinerariifolium]